MPALNFQFLLNVVLSSLVLLQLLAPSFPTFTIEPGPSFTSSFESVTSHGSIKSFRSPTLLQTAALILELRDFRAFRQFQFITLQ